MLILPSRRIITPRLRRERLHAGALGLQGGIGLSSAQLNGAAFTPFLLAGNLAWWDARAGITTPTSNHVSVWADQIGGDANGKNQLQATDGSRPTIASNASYNNQLIVSGASGQQMAPAGNWASSLTQPFTIYLVGESSTNGAVVIGNASVQVFQSSTSLVAFAGTTVSAGADAASVYCFVFNGASSAAYKLNSTTAVNTGNVGPNSAVVMNMFHGGGGNKKAAQILIRSGADNQSTRFKVMKYFGDLYAFPVT